MIAKYVERLLIKEKAAENRHGASLSHGDAGAVRFWQ
jgi:hypothetical protein